MVGQVFWDGKFWALPHGHAMLMTCLKGSAVRDMLPGYDCPHEAVYLPATTHNFEGGITRERAICVFEHDSGRPITRHTGYSAGEFGATRGYQLVVRSISTVGK